MTRSNRLRIISCVVCFGNGDVCCVRDDQIVCLIRNAVYDSDMAAVASLLVAGVMMSDGVDRVSMSCVSRQLQTDNTDSSTVLLLTDAHTN